MKHFVADPLQLSESQRFEIERLRRAIDGTHDLDALRAMAKELLKLWQTQKAATAWAIRAGCQPFATVTPADVEGEIGRARAAAAEIEGLERQFRESGGEEE
jgi:hypothetical protein